MRSFRADAPSKKRPHRNGDPHVVLVNTLVWKILVTRVNRKISRVEYGGNNRAAFGTALNNPKTRLREQDKHLFIQKDFPARGNRTRATGLSLGEKLPQEKKMRTVAIILGAAAAIAVAAPASADPAAGRVQLAQAQDAQSGSGMGASQQGSSGNRNSGAAAVAAPVAVAAFSPFRGLFALGLSQARHRLVSRVLIQAPQPTRSC